MFQPNEVTFPPPPLPQVQSSLVPRFSNLSAGGGIHPCPSAAAGFRIEKVPHADYFGFQLDGNGRCLMQDFVVTHNVRKKKKQQPALACSVKSKPFAHISHCCYFSLLSVFPAGLFGFQPA